MREIETEHADLRKRALATRGCRRRSSCSRARPAGSARRARSCRRRPRSPVHRAARRPARPHARSRPRSRPSPRAGPPCRGEGRSRRGRTRSPDRRRRSNRGRWEQRCPASTTSAPPGRAPCRTHRAPRRASLRSGSARQPYSRQVAKPAARGERTSTRRSCCVVMFCPPKSRGDVVLIRRTPARTRPPARRDRLQLRSRIGERDVDDVVAVQRSHADRSSALRRGRLP